MQLTGPEWRNCRAKIRCEVTRLKRILEAQIADSHRNTDRCSCGTHRFTDYDGIVIVMGNTVEIDDNMTSRTAGAECRRISMYLLQ